MIDRLALGLTRPWGSVVTMPQSPEEPESYPGRTRVNQTREDIRLGVEAHIK